jgi:PAS domain S-box-containing protein
MAPYLLLAEAAGLDPTLLLAALLTAATAVIVSGGVAAYLGWKKRTARPSAPEISGDVTQKLLDTTGEAVMLINRDGFVLLANPAARDALGGIDPVGRPVAHLVADTLFTRQLDKLARSAPVRDYEMVFRAQDGLSRYLKVTTTPLSGKGGGVLWLARDVTGQKRYEANSAESEERYRAVVEGASEGIFLAEVHTGRFVEANPAFTEMLGYTAHELRGMTLYNIQPHGHDGLDRSLLRLITEGRCRMGERAYRRKDDTLVDVEVSASLVMHGGREAMCAIVHDISEKKKSRERLERQLGRISALRSIDATIGSTHDLRVTLNVILDHVVAQLHADAASVLLLDRRGGVLEYGAGCGFKERGIEFTRLKLGEGHAGRAASEQRTVYVPDFTLLGNGRAALLADEGIVAYYALPLIAKGQVKGVLEIFGRSPLHPHAEWVDFAEALAGQAAIAIDNAGLLFDLQRANMELMLAYDSTLEGWSQALDLRDKETEGHTRRVTVATVRLAQSMGVPPDELVHMRRGALLHDIGKMGIPDAILLKPGPLTKEEWRIMRQHPVYAYKMLAPIPFLRKAIDIPYCHHEKWDGSGYPRGLRANDIPLAARIFTVVDVWDALRSNRPYRRAWSEERVRAHISSLSGTHLDPQVVKAFLESTMWHHHATSTLGRAVTAPLPVLAEVSASYSEQHP